MSEPYTRILLDTAADSPGHPATLYTDIRYSTVQYSTVLQYPDPEQCYTPLPRSVLNLTCAVYSPEVPAAIFWKHNGKVTPRRCGS